APELVLEWSSRIGSQQKQQPEPALPMTILFRSHGNREKRGKRSEKRECHFRLSLLTPHVSRLSPLASHLMPLQKAPDRGHGDTDAARRKTAAQRFKCRVRRLIYLRNQPSAMRIDAW